MSEGAVDLLSRLLHSRPDKRDSPREVLAEMQPRYSRDIDPRARRTAELTASRVLPQVATERLRAFMLAPPPPSSEAEGAITQAARKWFGQMSAGGSNAGPVAPAQLLRAVSARHREFAGRAQQDTQEV